jgi:transposase
MVSSEEYFAIVAVKKPANPSSSEKGVLIDAGERQFMADSSDEKLVKDGKKW